MTFNLLPQPVRIEPAAGSHPLDRAISILLSAGSERGEWIVARQLRTALSRRGVSGAIYPQSASTDARGAIVLAVAGRDEGRFPEVEALAVDGPESDEAYCLMIQPDRIVLTGATPAGLAQAVRTLIQLIQSSGDLPCLRIRDAPAMQWRGVMLDIARGKVPTLATMETIVDVIASFKLNMLQLYMESAFSFRRHPRIGEGWGAMTAEDVAALDAYCRDRYVELVPCYQSFGRRRLLSIPEYAHLSYSPELWTLAPGEETWRFLGELYDELLPCFTSHFVNVCCDESYDLTKTSAVTHEAAIGFSNRGEVGSGAPRTGALAAGMELYFTHVKRLSELLRARGKTMMLWDDIVQQAPSMLAELPSDTIFLCWFYEAAEGYPQPETIRRAGRRSMVCPGTATWNTLFARMENARVNIRRFIRDGLGAGSIGMLNTDWGDGGHPNFLGASWYGYAYGASESWTPGRLSDDEFDCRFGQLFFGAAEGDAAVAAMRLMSAACTLPGINKMNGSCTRAMFFRDPVADEAASLAPDEAVEEALGLGIDALELLTPLEGVDAECAQTLAEMRLAARQIIHAARKTRAGRRLAAAAPDDEESRRQLRKELNALKHELHELRWEYQLLWLARNKPEGIWLTLDQFDTAAQVLDRWRGQVAPAYSFGQ